METSHSLSRRERERCLRRRDMLEAAKAVFAEQSYAEATVEEIAERAEFGKGTIYLYFRGGKQEILAALLEEVRSEVEGRLRALVASAEAREDECRALLEAYVEWTVQHMVENHDLFVVTVKEWDRLLSGREHGQRPQWAEGFDEPLRLLARFFEVAAEQQAIRRTDAATLAHVFMHMLRGYVTALLDRQRHGADHPEDIGSGDAARFLTGLLFDGLGAQPAS